MFEIRINEKFAVLTTLVISLLSVQEKYHDEIGVKFPHAMLLNMS